MARPTKMRCAAIAVVAMVAVSCGGNSSHSSSPPSTSVPTPTPTRAPATPTTSADGLGSLLPTAVPSGFALQADSVGDTGPSDLAKAVRDDGTASGRAQLVGAKFIGGYQRLWAGAASTDRDVLYLYKFATTAGARTYMRYSFAHDTADQRSQGALSSSTFAAAAIPGASGLRATYAQQSIAGILFAKGAYLVQALVSGAPGRDQVAAATALAQALYHRLP